MSLTNWLTTFGPAILEALRRGKREQRWLEGASDWSIDQRDRKRYMEELNRN
jgi:hypothetical protein